MAAYFYTNRGGDVFKSGISDGSIVQINFLTNILTPANLIIYTDVGVGTSEIIQYFLTFNDVIDYLHFGKGLGTVEVSGLIFSDCSYNMPGVNALYGAFASVRGQTVKVSLGSYSANAVVVNSNVRVMAEPDTMAQFTIMMNIISDNQ